MNKNDEQRIIALEERIDKTERRLDEFIAENTKKIGPSITQSDLSGRAKNICKSAGIKTFEELSKYGSFRLLTQRNCGYKTIIELKNALLRAGYSSSTW